MNDKTNATLRSAMRQVVDITPDAPDFPPNVHGRRSAPFHRSANATGLIAVAAVLLVVVGLVTTLFTSSLRDSPVAAGTSPADADGWIVTVYFNEDIDAPTTASLSALEALPEVTAIHVVNKTQANAEALDLFADNEALIVVLAENPRLIPARLGVRATTEADATAIGRYAEGLEGVQQVEAPFYGKVDGLPPRYFSEVEENQQPTATRPGGTPTTTVPIVERMAVVFRPGTPTEAEKAAFTSLVNRYDTAIGFVTIDQATAYEQAVALFADDPDALAILTEYPDIASGYAQVDFASMEAAYAFQEAAGSADYIVAIVGANGPRLARGYSTSPQLPLAGDNVRISFWEFAGRADESTR